MPLLACFQLDRHNLRSDCGLTGSAWVMTLAHHARETDFIWHLLFHTLGGGSTLPFKAGIDYFNIQVHRCMIRIATPATFNIVVGVHFLYGRVSIGCLKLFIMLDPLALVTNDDILHKQA